MISARSFRSIAATLLVALFSVITPAFALDTSAPEPTGVAAFEAAKAQAAAEHKQLVVEFSGRTWCPPCKALAREVVPTDEFKAFIADRVYVQLDYPVATARTPEKVAASPELKKLMDLKEQYGVPGFPTVILFDSTGNELARQIGYAAGSGPKPYLGRLMAQAKK